PGPTVLKPLERQECATLCEITVIFLSQFKRNLSSKRGERKLISIREYNSSDLESLTELMTDLGYPTDINSMKIRMKSIEANSLYYTFVASLEDQVVGMIGARLVYYYEGDGVTTQVSALVTRGKYQGQGIGKELIRFIESWSKEKGSKSLFLTSGIKPERMEAHEFYKKMGFDINGYRFVKKFEE
ncbi:GNAT family N-acetyltransferase, partial [Paenibacillus sp. CMAA1364]